MIGRSGEVMVTRCGGGWRPGITAYLSNGGTLEAAGLEDGRAALFQERGPRGGEADRAGVDAAGGAGHDQTVGGGSGAAALDVLPPRSGRRGSRRTSRTGGTLEHAQQIAGHASPKTAKLYDRTADRVTVDEIERIVI